MTDFNGFHHAYLGLVLLLIGFIAIISGVKTKRRKRIATIILLLGFIIFFDDVWQHYKQFTDPSFRSPLHRLYGATLYHITLIRDLNAWMDKIFS
jgi:hypothetical protein